MTADLAGFLLARITEDESVARAAQPEDGVWYSAGETHLDTDAEERLLLRFNPTRVLAECEAKRRIIERLTRAADLAWSGSYAVRDDARASLADLALPYADHPDYRDEWRP